MNILIKNIFSPNNRYVIGSLFSVFAIFGLVACGESETSSSGEQKSSLRSQIKLPS